jgi:heme/copper-type cytochrome/quinol oxidase subunit 2
VCFSQGALYGIIVCGIKSFRIWFGPLPYEICHFQLWFSVVVLWYTLLSLFFISLAKFMYICVWKHMRDMNDNLIVTFVVRKSVFISIWVSTTGFSQTKSFSTQAICTDVFNDHDQIMDPELTPDKLPRPYNPLLFSIAIAILFFMVSVTYRRKRNSFSHDNKPFLRRPKDLESMLLNFAVLILLLINVIGYNLYFRGQVHNNESK